MKKTVLQRHERTVKALRKDLGHVSTAFIGLSNQMRQVYASLERMAAAVELVAKDAIGEILTEEEQAALREVVYGPPVDEPEPANDEALEQEAAVEPAL